MVYAEIVVNVPLTPHLPDYARLGKESASSSSGGESSFAPYDWLDQTFTYAVVPTLERIIAPGQLVWVPFGARRLQGIVVALNDKTDLDETRAVEEVVESRPLLSPVQIELARWIAHRYLAPLSECIWLMLPPGIEEKIETVYQVAGEITGDNQLSEKQREVMELVKTAHGVKSTRIPVHLRGAAESLVHHGQLVKIAHVRPPKAKPKLVKSVRLIADPPDIELALAKLGRWDLRAEILELLSQADVPVALDELCDRLHCKPTAVHRLGAQGWLEILPRRKVYGLTRTYFDTLPALPPNAARILVLLRERGNVATFEEIHESTRVTLPTLRALEKRGLLEEVETGERVRLLASPEHAPGSPRSPSRFKKVIDFLQREDGAAWISAVYAETGASALDLRKLERVGVLQFEAEEVFRDPLSDRMFARQVAPSLTSEQALAFGEIKSGLDAEKACIYLLLGVTGSGKTEIYINAIDHVLRRGGQAIALVPEIALTPQTIQRFGERFGARVGVIHSDLSYGERYDTWRRARDGKIDVLIGPRSALFVQLPRLGLIVIDEEHEPSYKQEGDSGTFRLPLYHTREVALELARLTHASVILGSATPDVETYYRAQSGEFKLLELPQRILAHGTGGGPVQYQDLPPVQVVDLRAELRGGNTSIFSRSLSAAIGDALAAHEQVILFLNRRGTATSVLCRTCGQAVKCPRCNNPFTLHQFGAEAANELVCHHCGKRGKVPRLCPNCGSTRVRALGLGTEKLEQVVRQNFPTARTLRWDRDVTRGKDSHEKILEAFTRGEADVLVGTQMIAKGLDLPRVTLVGVVNADTALNLPDFRASERTFQLLTQVAGRAGRSALGGKVIIQTFCPDHYAVEAAAQHDYKGFYEQELRFRREAGYPPIRPLVRLLFVGARETDAREASERLAGALQDRIRRQGLLDVELIGPAPAFFAKWGGKYRYHLILRGSNARTLLAAYPLPPGWRVDVDPMNLL